MKISESTSFPHPVLAPWSADISGATFSTEIVYREDDKTNQFLIHCTASLDQPDIAALIKNGSANFGCFIKCQETGFRRLQRIIFPTGNHDFAPGALLGRVQIRPMIWSVKPIFNFCPAGVHSEFAGAIDLETGQILALDEEQVIDVAPAPLPAIESIFEIKSSDDIPDDRFEVETEEDRITITMGKNTYRLVQELRQTADDTRAVAMNALYIPVIMQVLEQVGSQGTELFEQYRWFNSFKLRCDLSSVDLSKLDLFNDAQKMLSIPFYSLKRLTQSQGASCEL